MAKSFFHLTPDNDPHAHGPRICADCAAEMAEEPEAERTANRQAAIALGNALLEALDAYTDVHEDTTYRHIFEGLAFLHWMLQRERDEEEADA